MESRAFDVLRTEHSFPGPVWTKIRHQSFPKYFRKRIEMLCWINKISWKIPTDVLELIFQYYSKVEQELPYKYIPGNVGLNSRIDSASTYISYQVRIFSEFS